ncbi:unnamed protein product [Brassica rapa subsp. trilocularis]
MSCVENYESESLRYLFSREQIQKTRSGLVQQALKARAMRLLKQKKMYEGQRDMLYNQTFNLDQVSFAAEGLKDAQQTVMHLSLSRLPWGSLSVNNSEFWSPSSAGTQLLKEGTPFSYNAGNLSSSKVHQKELWLSQILACVFIRCCIWPSRTLSRNKLNGTIPVSLTGLPNLINLFFYSNNLNGQIPQTLFQIPKYNFTGNNLNCGVGQPHPCVSEVARSGIDIKDTNVMCSWMLQVGSWMLQLYHLKLVWSVLCCGLFELYIVVLLRTSTSEPE